MSEGGHDLVGRTLLGRYRVVLPIGRGGMGTVYLARTEGAAGFARPVVVKCIQPEHVGDSGMVMLFVREARILSNLHHPGIVNVLDFDAEGGVYVMVLEYVHGYDLGAWLSYIQREKHDRMPFGVALFIALRVLETLQYAHTYARPDGKPLSIIHRDVSPGNILVDSGGMVKLADFGVARATDDAGEYKSRLGTFKGKLAYSAPELVQGAAATPQSDLYALGVVLLNSLLGSNPFKGDNMAESVQRVVTLEPPRVASVRSDVPRAIDAVLAKALAKDPHHRYATAGAFHDALKTLRPPSLDQLQTEIEALARRDFSSDMAERLGLASLTVRDAAWRDVQGASVRLDSTPPPPLRGRARSDNPTIVQVPKGRRRSRGRLLWGGAGALVLLASGAGTTYALIGGRARPAAEPKYVVIERRSVNDSELVPAQASSEEVAAPPPASAPTSPATSPLPPTSSAAPANGDTAALTGALQKQQGRFQACFEQHVERLAGSPRVSIHFRLGAGGAVEAAELDPASVSGTPLGNCLLSVARSTPFPAPGKPLSFHVPITARVSR